MYCELKNPYWLSTIITKVLPRYIFMVIFFRVTHKRPICTYFTRWLIRMNSYDLTHTIVYDLSKPQWRVDLGAGLGVGHLYKFIRMGNS